MIKLKNTHCPLCMRNEETELFNKDSMRYVQCRSCGLVYVNPRLSKKDTYNLYNSNVLSPHDYYIENRDADIITFTKRLKLIERFAFHKGSILDIGCNIGTLLRTAYARGWKCYGIDVNKSVSKFSNKQI